MKNLSQIPARNHWNNAPVFSTPCLPFELGKLSTISSACKYRQDEQSERSAAVPHHSTHPGRIHEMEWDSLWENGPEISSPDKIKEVLQEH